jgi:hypothetical protein
MLSVRFLFAAVAVLGLAGACNALNGVGDLEEVPCTDRCGDGAVDDRPESPDTTPGVDSGGEGASDVADAGSPLQKDATGTGVDGSKAFPSFCSGILMYLPFDTSLASTAGEMPATGTTTPLVGGKFGMAADLTGAVNTTPNMMEYPVSYDGGVGYTLAQGSIALWVKPSWDVPCSTDRVFVKPAASLASSSTGAGPELACRAQSPVGILVEEADGGLVPAWLTASANGWVAGNWNHLVGTWSVSPQRMSVFLNGGGSSDLGTSSAPWTPGEGPPTYLRLGSNNLRPASVFDEVVVWGRELGVNEVADVYASTVSVGAACGL